MHELRLVAVSEDGSYAVLAVPGRGGRFSLPIDDRLRTVARGPVLPARAVRDRSGESVATQGDPGPDPRRRDGRRDRRRGRLSRSTECAGSRARSSPSGSTGLRRRSGPRCAATASRARARGWARSSPSGWPRLGAARRRCLEWDSRKRSRRQLAGAAGVHHGRPAAAGGVGLRPPAQARHAGRRRRRPALPARGRLARDPAAPAAATATVTVIGSHLPRDARPVPDRARRSCTPPSSARRVMPSAGPAGAHPAPRPPSPRRAAAATRRAQAGPAPGQFRAAREPADAPAPSPGSIETRAPRRARRPRPPAHPRRHGRRSRRPSKAAGRPVQRPAAVRRCRPGTRSCSVTPASPTDQAGAVSGLSASCQPTCAHGRARSLAPAA